jgi:hypothetical protein
VLTAGPDRLPQINDLVVDHTAASAYGEITVVTDATHVTVAYVNTLQGPAGTNGTNGTNGADGVVQGIVAGTNVSVDATDPAHPVVSSTGGGGGVESIVAGDYIAVDATDPANPIVNTEGVVVEVVAGSHITVDSSVLGHPQVSATGIVESVEPGNYILVDDTDPLNPIVSVNPDSFVQTIVPGTGVTVDDTDPANPIVSATGGGSGISSLTSSDGTILVDLTDPTTPDIRSNANSINGGYASVSTVGQGSAGHSVGIQGFLISGSDADNGAELSSPQDDGTFWFHEVSGDVSLWFFINDASYYLPMTAF